MNEPVILVTLLPIVECPLRWKLPAHIEARFGRGLFVLWDAKHQRHVDIECSDPSTVDANTLREMLRMLAGSKVAESASA